MILHANHTHLFPGCRGSVSAAPCPDDWPPELTGVLEFSDGAATGARLSKAGEYWLLQSDAYLTAAGTRIEHKRWRVELTLDGQQTQFRVLANVTTAKGLPTSNKLIE